ncbi:unnamed protein product [Bursaphelenchus okinawaensis]|uniref:Chromo domain-containing protein n=1 Tax=Bursaphelenchus okinawaensis TaxID=465554 RepID=A0A811LKR2_9BILA|nr:unnamed protein product [Bursaphelenchus okinawaensis]CAG9125713.1 unnamed protein product [Bursaphelenchus okinawaensis]
MSGKGDAVEVDKEESDVDDEEDIFEVDYLMGTKMIKGVRHFHVRWKGYDENHDSWEPEENLEGSMEIVNKFMEEYNAKKKSKGKAAKAPAKKKAKIEKAEEDEEEDVEDDKADEDDKDDDYSVEKRKSAKGQTSKTSEPSTSSNYKSSVLKFQEGCIKRKANEGRLRWLESDSNDSDEDTNSKNDVLSESKEKEDASEGPSASIEPLKFSLPTGLQPDEPNVEASSPSSQKSKKKKKKSKKQKRGKSRSKSSSPPTQSSATSNSLLQSGSQISFVGAFLPLNSNDISYVATNNVHQFTYTFDEAFQANSRGFCEFLASKIEFGPQGQLKVKLPRMNGV